MMKAMKSGEMIGLSSALLDEERHRPVFRSIPLLAGLLAEIEAAHGGLGAEGRPRRRHAARERHPRQRGAHQDRLSVVARPRGCPPRRCRALSAHGTTGAAVSSR